MPKRKHRRKKRRNSGMSTAILLNPGFGFKRARKRRRKKNVMARKRKHRRRNKTSAPHRRRRRRRHNPGFFANPRRKHRRRRRHNPHRRHHRRHRRRNPMGGIVSAIMAAAKHIPGGAAAGALDAAVVDSLLRNYVSDRKYRAAAKIAAAPIVGALVSKVPKIGSMVAPYAGDFVAGYSAIGAKELVGELMGTPQAKLGQLADTFAALIDQGQVQGADELAALIDQGQVGDMFAGDADDGDTADMVQTTF